VADHINAEAFIAPTFGQRLGGRFLDGALLFLVSLTLSLVLDGVRLRTMVFAIAAVYDIAGVAVWGQTIGKRVAGTRVVSMVSDRIEPSQAVVRFFTYGGIAFILTAIGVPFLGEVFTIVVVAPILRAPLHRGLHDLAARTIVVPTRTWSAR
jgi:uncharacterized RDD family membrane protein YckC